MKHLLPELPFAKNALEPIMSSETLEYHHGKHHKKYVDEVNRLVVGTRFEDLSLTKLVLETSGPLFNNAAQAWNHDFFWKCLSPNRGKPSGELLEAIERDFKSLDEFESKFKQIGSGVFGSGWAWLIRDSKTGTLLVQGSSNADNPMKAGFIPILVCDVWEHAYYIDYRNDRATFLQKALGILNWDFAALNFSGATRTAAAA